MMFIQIREFLPQPEEQPGLLHNDRQVDAGEQDTSLCEVRGDKLICIHGNLAGALSRECTAPVVEGVPTGGCSRDLDERTLGISIAAQQRVGCASPCRICYHGQVEGGLRFKVRRDRFIVVYGDAGGVDGTEQIAFLLLEIEAADVRNAARLARLFLV